MRRIKKAIREANLIKAQFYSEYRFPRELKYKKELYPDHIEIPDGSLVLFSFSIPS